MQGKLSLCYAHAQTLFLPQVPTPITEMEISVKRVRAAARFPLCPLSPAPCPGCNLLENYPSLLEGGARQA